MSKRVHFIINPAAGKEEPILSYINTALRETELEWDISITKKVKDAYELTQKALKNNADIIAVYGGDGTVMEASLALFGKATPLLILPGGTANVMVKELGISSDTKTALELLKQKKMKFKTIDMGIFDKRPFLIRINVGILAHMVRTTDRRSKDTYGQLAYSIAAVKHILNHDTLQFKMVIDGKEVKETGVALMVANAGNMGITGYSILPRVSVTDGLLDVVLFKTVQAESFFNWIQSTIRNKKPYGSIRHWKAKEVKISISPQQPIICDDISITVDSFSAKVMPQALTVVVP